MAMKRSTLLLLTSGLWFAANTGSHAVSVYAAAVLADNPVGYWRLDETSGTVAGAVVGSNGSYQGTPGLGQPGAVPVDGAANLAAGIHPANSAYVATTASLPASFTVEMWIKSNTPTWNSYWGMASRTGSGFFLNGYQGGTTVYFELLGQTMFGYGAVGFTAPDITGWHHYAGTYDAATNTAVIYFDGQPVNTRSNILNEARGAATLPMQWGAEAGLGRYGNGALDELAVYGSALSGTQIQAHYLAAIPEAAHSLLSVLGVSALALRRIRRRPANR